jgi:hypothetical protein
MEVTKPTKNPGIYDNWTEHEQNGINANNFLVQHIEHV